MGTGTRLGFPFGCARCRMCLIAIATIVERGPIGSGEPARCSRDR
jgi:hypothetical protein